MMAEERAALNRRAAELAGWTFAPFTTLAEDGEAFEWLRVTLPDGREQVWGLLRPDGWDYEAEAPDFVGEPALWWPLVERMARLSLERDDLEWEGPFLSTLSGRWRVEWQIGDRRWDAAEDEEPGVAVVRAALAVAEALGLYPCTTIPP